MMDKGKAIELLREALNDIPHLRELHYDNQEFKLWHDKVQNIIKAALDTDDLKRFSSWRAIHVRGWFSDNVYQKDYLDKLTDYETALKSIIEKHEILGIEIKPAAMTGLPPKAFIAHEGETRALTMLKEFLEALEIQYFIAEAKASGGRSIEGQVDWTQSKADFAICLATKGKAINKKTGKHYMAPNIIDELGRARQVFGNKIILLVQKGVEVHTNVREIVYETFTTTNVEKAFIKIAKELRNWGFIRVGKA